MSDSKTHDLMSAIIAFIESNYKISPIHSNTFSNKIEMGKIHHNDTNEMIRCQICSNPDCNKTPCPSSNDIK